MPRSPLNTPTARIMRMLDDVAELEGYAAALENAAATTPEFEKLPPRPPLKAITEERTRQSLLGRRNVRAKEAVRRHRLRVNNRAQEALDQETKDGILKELTNGDAK